MRTTIWSGLLVGMLGLSAVQAEETLEAQQIRIGTEGQGLELMVSGLQERYGLHEPIRFQVQGDRTFYLWVYARDPNGDAVRLIPGDSQRGNRYHAGVPHWVPNPGLEFYGDEAGPHELTLVASTRWLDVDLERLGTVEQMDAAFAAKGIGIREDRPRTEGIVIRHLPVRIEGAAAAPPADDTLVFARMDRDEYRIGERFRLVYGATESGWLQVYVHEPDGAPVRLTEQAVDEHRLYEVAGRVTGPAGRHEVRAYFKPGESPGESRQAAGEFAAKGLMLDDDEQAAAVYPFTVRQ